VEGKNGDALYLGTCFNRYTHQILNSGTGSNHIHLGISLMKKKKKKKKYFVPEDGGNDLPKSLLHIYKTTWGHISEHSTHNAHYYQIRMKSKFIFRNVTPCCPANQCLGGMYYLHLQGWRLSQTSNQHEACNKYHSAWLTQFWIERKQVLPKRRWVSIRQHGIKHKTIVSFIAMGVRTSYTAIFEYDDV
jgi:hypothetical protein